MTAAVGIGAILRSNRDYRLLWISNLLTGFGDAVFETTLLVWIATDLAAGMEWAPSATSVLLVCSVIPVLTVGPFAGVHADRANPRQLRLRMTWLHAGLVALLAGSAAIGTSVSVGAQVAVILAVVLIASVAAQFLGPAASVMTRTILPEEQIPVAAAFNQMVGNINVFAAPAVAAMLFAAFGPVVGLAVEALAFVMAAVLVRHVANREEWDHAPADAAWPAFRADLVAGFQMLRSLPAIRTVITGFAVVMFAASCFNALDIYFVVDQVGVSRVEYGWLFTIQGIGMIAGSALAVRLLPRIDPMRLYGIGIAAFGCILIVYSRMGSFSALAVVTLVLGVAVAIMSAPVSAIVIAFIPKAYVGRISSLMVLAIQSGTMAGLAVGGFAYTVLMDRFDVTIGMLRFRPLDTLFTCAAIVILGAGGWAMLVARRMPGAGTVGRSEPRRSVAESMPS